MTLGGWSTSLIWMALRKERIDSEKRDKGLTKGYCGMVSTAPVDVRGPAPPLWRPSARSGSSSMSSTWRGVVKPALSISSR